MHFAKSINGENYKGYVKDNSTIGTIDKHVSAMPAPKKGATKKKVAAAPEGAEGEKKPAKGQMPEIAKVANHMVTQVIGMKALNPPMFRISCGS